MVTYEPGHGAEICPLSAFPLCWVRLPPFLFLRLAICPTSSEPGHGAEICPPRLFPSVGFAYHPSFYLSHLLTPQPEHKEMAEYSTK
jgi:hypothetical protein